MIIRAATRKRAVPRTRGVSPNIRSRIRHRAQLHRIIRAATRKRAVPRTRGVSPKHPLAYASRLGLRHRSAFHGKFLNDLIVEI